MGYSGLIYAAIVAAWAAFLVPRWVRRNEEVESAREADAARGVRVLRRRNAGAIHASHRGLVDGRRTVLHGSPAGLTVGGAERPESVQRDTPGPVRQGAPSLREFDDAFAAAARRRRRIVVALVVGTVVLAVAGYAGRVPGWAPLAAMVALAFFLVVARRAAVVQATRRRELVRAARRNAARQHVSEPAAVDEPVDTDEVAPAEPRRIVLPDEPADSTADPDAWDPVPVPRPTYMTKAKAPRVVRTIDLSQPGSWTSGRLDPASSIELPRRERDAGGQTGRAGQSSAAAKASADGAAGERASDGQAADGQAADRQAIDGRAAGEHIEHRRAVGD